MDKADIEAAALKRFVAQGYESTTVRQLARDLGVTSAAFYYHYTGKAELLSDVLEGILRSDLATFRAIRRESDNPLDLMLGVHVAWNETEQMKDRVVHNEIQFLEGPAKEKIRGLVREYEAEFSEVIASEYDLTGENLEFATKAVLGMVSSVADWFRYDGRVPIEHFSALITRYARGVLATAEKTSLADADGRLIRELRTIREAK